MRDCLYLSLYYILFVVALLPKSCLKALSHFIAKLVFKLNHKHTKIVQKNLAFCFPQYEKQKIQALSLKIYENFAYYGMDFFKNQNISVKDLNKKVSIENEQALNTLILKAKQEDRAIIFITAHFGNWELLPLIFAHKFGAISVVSRSLDSKVMDKLITKKRSRFDIEMIDKVGGLKKMLKALKQKRALGILPDQDGHDNESMVLEFFGKKVNWLLGASIVAKKSEALLIPAFIYQKEQDLYSIKVFEAMDSKEHSKEELTLYQAKCCEKMIKFKPDEYFFFHKRFKRFYNALYEN